MKGKMGLKEDFQTGKEEGLRLYAEKKEAVLSFFKTWGWSILTLILGISIIIYVSLGV